MATIPVNTPDGGSYDIIIEPGALARMADILAERGLSGRTIVGTNTTLSPLYGRDLSERLENAVTVTLPDGEQYKTLDTAGAVFSGLVKLGLDRGGLIIALGGGVIGDTMGFIAATYMRGVRFVQAPTSLLAMVDASVGGKTGVDLPEGKNLVGAFKQPEVVVIDPDVLATLPDVEWRCGLAEVVKHGLLADPALLEIDRLQRERAAEFLPRAIQVKVDVVQQDPFEHGVRAHLNLGHTFGHALELVSGFTWKHGEAVAIGMAAAARLSARLALCDPALGDQIEALLNTLGLPTRLGSYDPEGLWEAMAADKKWRGGVPHFVLLKGIGQPVTVPDVPATDVIAVLQELRG
ncbi:MAG: 3-dehydroquinate synthase [Anaerolineae bacterium]|nr:3-dehydroquinate synthase [Anaerolineae bacterium]